MPTFDLKIPWRNRLYTYYIIIHNLHQSHHSFLEITLIAPNVCQLVWRKTGWNVCCSSDLIPNWLFAVDPMISNSANPLAPSPQQKPVNNHLFHHWLFILSSHHPWSPPFCSTLPTRSLLTLLSLSPSPLTPGCFGGHSAGAANAPGCHSGLLGAVIGGHAGQHTTAATDPLRWWWYLHVINLGTLCKLHREAEN